MLFRSVFHSACALGLLAGVLAAPAFAADKDPLVAEVNGAKITQSDLLEFQRSLPPQLANAPYEALLEIVISNRLVSEQARKDQTGKDPQVRQAVAQAEERILRQAWMSKKLKEAASDAAVRKRYDEYLAQFKPQDEVHARHILVKTEAEAKTVIQELDGGAKFEDVAKAKTIDPSGKASGGDLGFFAKGEMVPQFAEAAFALADGAVSKTPVQTQYGWHVIKVEGRRQSAPPSFEEAREPLREQVAEQAAESLVATLTSKAKIVRYNQDGTPMKAEPAAK